MAADPPKPVYTAADLASFDYDRDLGYPGQYPFTRGIHPTMYRGQRWTMQKDAGSGDAAESNRRIHFLIANGATGLSFAFDRPTQLGRDSDDQQSVGSVGKSGIAIDSIEDMERLFSGVDLDRIAPSLAIDGPAAILLAFYVASARHAGVDSKQLRGSIQNDFLSESITRGVTLYPTTYAMRLATDMITWTAEHIPRLDPICISGYSIREAGATAAQEIAFAFANAIAYLQSAIKAGLDIDRIAPRIGFCFSAHNNFFEEIAKFRAARRLWARVVRDRFHAKDPRAMMLRFTTQTARSTLTAEQPENNIARAAVQTLTAVLGGTQSLDTAGYDGPIDSEEAARTALRTQQIIAGESGVANTIDPFAGSYYLESLTSDLELEAAALLDQIDAQGGMLSAPERQRIRQEIQSASAEQQRAVASGETTIVGVNRFLHETASAPSTKHSDIEQSQIERLRALRSRRDPIRWQSSLDQLKVRARSSENIMPALIDATKNLATIGEISAALSEVFGES